MINSCWNQIGVWGDQSCPELKSLIHCHNCCVYSTAGRQLLNREPPQAYLNEQTSLFTKKEQQLVETISLSIFRLREEWFALPVQIFQEVTETSSIRTLPHRTNKIFLGLVSIRGDIQLCISLSELLGLETVSSNSNLSPIIYKRMVVIAKEGNQWAFEVDEIYGVHRIPTNLLLNVPNTISKATITYTKAIVEWHNKHISYLDEELVFYTLNKKVL
jgi:chemotaxis-related protein WspD